MPEKDNIEQLTELRSDIPTFEQFFAMHREALRNPFMLPVIRNNAKVFKEKSRQEAWEFIRDVWRGDDRSATVQYLARGRTRSPRGAVIRGASGFWENFFRAWECPDKALFPIQSGGWRRWNKPFDSLESPFSCWILHATSIMFRDWVREELARGRIPDLGSVEVAERLLHYWATAAAQYTEDAFSIKHGEPLQLRHFAADGRAPPNPDQIRQREFGRLMLSQEEQDDRILRELLFTELTDAQIATVSENLPSDPVARRALRELVKQAIPGSGEFSDLPGNALDIDPGTAAEAIMRETRATVESAPEYWVSDRNKKLVMQKKLVDFSYWRKYHPQVALLPSANPAIPPRVLRRAWTKDEPAPLVNLTVLPRKKEMPEPGFLGELLTGTSGMIIGAVLSAIPVIGPVLAVGARLQGQSEMRDWAEEVEDGIPTEAFEPQYDPREFTIPLPLDRAQLAVEKPWLTPAMFEQFRQEILDNKIQSSAAAYRELTGKRLKPGDLPNFFSPDEIINLTGRNPLLTGDGDSVKVPGTKGDKAKKTYGSGNGSIAPAAIIAGIIIAATMT